MVRVTTSGITSFHGVTGGVYKARERIHRCIADQRLLAIPTSYRRVSAYNPNWVFFEVLRLLALKTLLFVKTIVARL